MSIALAQRRDPFAILTAVLLFGYLMMTRTFAHVGFKPLYLGELALGTFLVVRPSSIALPFLGALAVPSRLSQFCWCLAIWLIYGTLECMRALLVGSEMSLIGEVFVVHLYPLYVLVGLWIGGRCPDFTQRIWPFLAWLHGLYGVLFIVVLNPLGLVQALDSPTVVPLFGTPAGESIVLLGLLAFSRGIRRDAIPLLLNLFVFLCMQRRAVWLAFALAVIVWAYLSGRMRQLMICLGLLAGVLAIGLIPGVEFPSPGFRGKPLSTYEIIGRLVAPFDPDAASGLSENAADHASTAHWRDEFWSGIWDEVHSTNERTLFGLGYGYPLWQLHTVENLEDNPVRTPHSIFMFVLGYAGWIGILLFIALQLSLGRLVWGSYLETGEAFGVSLWAMTMFWALLDPLLERPYGAIPLYLLMGLSVWWRRSEHDESPQGGHQYHDRQLMN